MRDVLRRDSSAPQNTDRQRQRGARVPRQTSLRCHGAVLASLASQMLTSAEHFLSSAVPLNVFQIHHYQRNYSQLPLRGISQKSEDKVCPLHFPS